MTPWTFIVQGSSQRTLILEQLPTDAVLRNKNNIVQKSIAAWGQYVLFLVHAAFVRAPQTKYNGG